LTGLFLGDIRVHLVLTGCRLLGPLDRLAGCRHSVQQMQMSGCRHSVQQMQMSEQQVPAQSLEVQKAVPEQTAAVPGGLAEAPGSRGRRSKGKGIGGLEEEKLVRTGR